MTIGNEIKNARKKAGLTQKELGKRLGISYQTVAQWENDLRKPKFDTILRISKALEVDPYSLMDFDMATAVLSDHINNRAKYLLTAFDQLNDEGQTKAIERVEELTEIPKYKKEPPQD